MKKILMLSMLIFALVLGGCSSSDSSIAKDKPKGEFPTKPIEMIVPFAAGGSTDAAARALASVVNKYMPNGQSVVVVNKSGGAGTIGLAEVLNAKPDGYKIGLTAAGPISIQPHYGQAPYTHDSFQTIMRVTAVPQVLVVQSDAPWKTFEEWLDYVKQNPGKFTYSTAGTGGPPHIAMEALNTAAGIQTKNVPFDGGAPAVTALLGGHVHGAVVQPQEAIAHIDSGALRALVNVGESKIESFKDTPLLKEKGIDVAVDVFNGIIAPKGLPQEELDILHDAFKKALEDPAVIEQYNKLGIQPAYAGPEDFQKTITDSFNTNGDVMKKIGLIQ